MSSRCFRNPFQSNGRSELNKKFYKKRILECVDQIRQNLEPSRRNGEKGLYTGTAGVAYALYRLAESNLIPELNEMFEKMATSYIKVALDEDNVRHRKEVGLMSGNSGVYLVAALLCAKNNERTCEAYLREYTTLANLCEAIEFQKDGSDELFVGRAGYLFGILMLQRELGVEVLSDTAIHSLCNAVIESGRKSRRHVELPGDLPLLYQYHSKAYLGSAHGMAGIFQALLSFPSFLHANPEAVDFIRRSVDYLLHLCYDKNNIATNLEAALSGHGKFLVHWCHGAAGIIYLFARAYIVFDQDEKYYNACVRLAETVWQEGLLKKGPGICHGVAGSGYVFLLMYRLTGDENYLYRAERFASFLFTEEFTNGARTPDRPFSLFEGWAGTICFLTDLLQPDKAEYPFMNVFLE